MFSFYMEQTPEREAWCRMQQLKGAIETMKTAALVFLIPTVYFWTVISKSHVWVGGRGVVVEDHQLGGKLSEVYTKHHLKAECIGLKQAFGWVTQTENW